MSLVSQPSKLENEAGEASDYQPSVNRHARALIARIQKNQDDVDAIRELEAHYEQTGDQPSLVNLMEGWGDTLREPRAAADAYVRAADAALVGLRDRTRAKALYERALSRDATHLEALDRVLRLLGDDDNFERQKQVLKFVAYRLGEIGYATPQDAQHHASVHYRLGQVYETRFSEPGKAAMNYRRAIEINPRLVPAIIAARKIYHDVGNAKAVAALYEFELDATPGIDDKRALLVALAEARHHTQHDFDGAITALRRALQLAPGDTEALRLLGEVLVARSEQGDKISGSLDRRRAAEVFFQVGRSLPARDARAYLLRALELCPEHAKAAALLHDLGTRENPEDKTELLDLAEITAAEPAREVKPPPVPEAGVQVVRSVSVEDHAATTQMPPLTAQGIRDSVEAWLHETQPESSSLSTGELLPLDIHPGTPAQERPSSLPPRSLAESIPAPPPAFPLHEALRAPRVPTLHSSQPPAAADAPSDSEDIRRSSMLPATRRRSSAAPPPIEAPPSHSKSQFPKPAYAEIPGATSDDFTPVRAVSLKLAQTSLARQDSDEADSSDSQREPTLIAWRLPGNVLAGADESIEAAHAKAVSEAPTPAVGAVLPVKPSRASERDMAKTPVDVLSPLAALAVTSTRASSTPEPAPEPVSERRPKSSRKASRSEASQNDRFSELARGAREKTPVPPSAAEPVSSVPRPMSTLLVTHEPMAPALAAVTEPPPMTHAAPITPAPVAPTATAAVVRTPIPRPVTPTEATTRVRVLAGELPFESGRTEVEANVGVATDSNFYVGFSNRVADGGIFVATYNPLPIGTLVHVLVTLPGNFSARVHGRVQLVRETLDPFSDDIPGMCIQLQTVSEGALALFERFASLRPALFIED